MPFRSGLYSWGIRSQSTSKFYRFNTDPASLTRAGRIPNKMCHWNLLHHQDSSKEARPMDPVLEGPWIILDTVPEAYVRLDNDFRFTFVNRAALSLFGKMPA